MGHLSRNAFLYLTQGAIGSEFAGYSCGSRVGYSAVNMDGEDLRIVAPIDCPNCVLIAAQIKVQKGVDVQKEPW